LIFSEAYFKINIVYCYANNEVIVLNIAQILIIELKASYPAKNVRHRRYILKFALPPIICIYEISGMYNDDDAYS
jgi:hypothetical protein